MTQFRRYTHLEKLNKDVVKNIMGCDHIIVQAKLDGCNSSVWYNEKDNILCCGSRSRTISIEKDNGGFCDYITNSDDKEIDFLRNFCKEHPNYIVYGEFLGVPGRKFLGTIKNYVDGGFFIFDVFDADTGEYLPYATWSNFFKDNYSRVVPLIAELDNIDKCSSIDQLTEKYADKTDFNLPNGMRGEGMTIKAEPAYRNVYGDIQIGKIVFDEYLAKKNKPKKNVVPQDSAEYIQEFVEKYCTEAFMSKEQNKIMVALEMDTWENKGKCIGMMMQSCINNLMHEEFWDYFKKHLVVLDLSILKRAIEIKVRNFLGL